jgi:hypothetical protein
LQTSQTRRYQPDTSSDEPGRRSGICRLYPFDSCDIISISGYYKLSNLWFNCLDFILVIIQRFIPFPMI